MTVEKRNSPVGAFCLLVFIAVLVTTLQHWVGKETLYSATFASMRQETHDFLVGRRQQTNDSNLTELGSFGNERRVVIPWLVEVVSRLTGNRESSIPAIYYYTDYVCLYASLLLFWFYLRHWFDELHSLLGLTFVAVALITTFHEHFFHPWDRPTFLLWIVMAMLVRNNRLFLYLPILALTLCTKFTAVLFPAFYAMIRIERGRDLLKPSIYAPILAQIAVVAGCHLFLDRVAFTTGARLADSYIGLAKDVITENLHDFAIYKLAHPAVLMLSCPLLLIPFGWRQLDHYMRSSVRFAVILLLIHMAITYFSESRALAGALIFLVPPALSSLDSILPGRSNAEPAHSQ